MPTVGWSEVRVRSGGPGWHPGPAAEQLGERIECADVVLGRGGEVGADRCEPLGSRQALEAVAHLGVDLGHADSGLGRVVGEENVEVGGEPGGLGLQLHEGGGQVVAGSLQGVPLASGWLRVGGKARGGQFVVAGEEAGQYPTGKSALPPVACMVRSDVHLGQECSHVVGPALIPADADRGQLAGDVRQADRMGRFVVAEVHRQPVVDHGAPELREHARLVGCGPPSRHGGGKEGVELVGRDVEPQLVGPDLVKGLIHVEKGRGPQALLQGIEEADQVLGRLGDERGDEAGGDRTPEEGRHRLSGALDGEVLAHEQVGGRRPHVRAVGGGSLGLFREGALRRRPAGAAFGHRPVLGAGDDRNRRIEHLAALHSLDRRIGEVVATGSAARRLVVDDLVGIGPHRQVRPRCTGLLSPVALHIVSALRLRLSPSCRTGLGRLCLVLRRVGRRGHRRVLGAPVQTTAELVDPTGQALDLTDQCRVLHAQGLDLGFEQVFTVRVRHPRQSTNTAVTSRIRWSRDQTGDGYFVLTEDLNVCVTLVDWRH